MYTRKLLCLFFFLYGFLCGGCKPNKTSNPPKNTDISKKDVEKVNKLTQGLIPGYNNSPQHVEKVNDQSQKKIQEENPGGGTQGGGTQGGGTQGGGTQGGGTQGGGTQGGGTQGGGTQGGGTQGGGTQQNFADILRKMRQDMNDKKYHIVLGMNDEEYANIPKFDLIDTIEKKHKERVCFFEKAVGDADLKKQIKNVLNNSYFVLLHDMIEKQLDKYQLFGLKKENATVIAITRAYYKIQSQLDSAFHETKDVKGYLYDNAYATLNSVFKELLQEYYKNNPPKQPGNQSKEAELKKELDQKIDQCKALSEKKKRIFKRINNSKDIFSMLDLPNGAQKNEIKKAFFKIMLSCHPDKNDPDVKEIATQITQQLNACYAKT
ncbi:J domain-containing protein [Cardinium endosymbiont of Culicoides punctatus]|uniref:J domain-containing protein n=1 Tax=Cardinium endosymbiont of Culicoides punctatus TaxID=2304601 RepID=UPI001058951D|nr:J domain-containing protein [Cardinium endosymbiont of Culicoides punctatus]TDG95670.1 hypothetical protein CCPUN_01300 [Cardinium endosymbiont of Culicoides punctatus]